MTNEDYYGLIGLISPFMKACKSQKGCATCPIGKAKRESFRLNPDGPTNYSCVFTFAAMERKAVPA